jgi:hypothetical protein
MNLASYWKSILAFLALVATNLSANVANSGDVAPQTAGEWVTLLVTTVVGTALVYAKKNEGAA